LQQGASKTGLPVAAIELPARASTPMDHSKGGYRLLLKGLTQPLKDGDRFDLQLQFERAGSVTIKVWMQACQACKN
jgi:copper(I)-binding protein